MNTDEQQSYEKKAEKEIQLYCTHVFVSCAQWKSKYSFSELFDSAECNKSSEILNRIS